ncbi:uncharacterized protein B0I36DRAFT_350609 [Microdochium trichocladiopsis]|uniref:BZIP domain-containing protein n=1 Tax=Microdochium trichocladiopsis TaxID=1682393 RepID=A0A9P9BPZ7_9PEZI|nr:uncharacterized protein B0I36DRAFT_350609 [Microdochium trichocladiopsis]KAH7029799.1 hypothetical protein B0I36DRAFT_350609 [Microdochium trichocladiopsis]
MPLEDGDAEAELKRRRERARHAQSAFRKRQAEAQRELQASHEQLKDAVRDLLYEMQADDRPQLRERIVHAARIAGLGDVDGQEMQPAGHASVQATSTSQRPSRQSGAAAAVHRGRESVAVEFPRAEHRAILQSNTRFSPISLPWETTNSHARSIIYPDPFLYLSIIGPPAEMLPFLGQGAYTFGGRLTWYVLERAFAAHDAAVKQAHSGVPSTTASADHPTFAGPAVASPQSMNARATQAVRKRHGLDIHEIVSTTRSHEARLRIVGLISLLNAFFAGAPRRGGAHRNSSSSSSSSSSSHSSDQDSPPGHSSGSDPASADEGLVDWFVDNPSAIATDHRNVLNWTREMQQLVEREYAEQGEVAREWLSPLAAEQRVRAIVGDDIFAVLSAGARRSLVEKQRQVRGEGEGGGGHEEGFAGGADAFDSLLDTLYQTYKCFGDGPRWHVRVLDGVVMHWAQSLTAGGVASWA